MVIIIFSGKPPMINWYIISIPNLAKVDGKK